MTEKTTYEELEQRVQELDKKNIKFKQVEKALQESEKKHRHMVESTVDWVWSVDIKGIHTFTNKSIGQHLGYTIEEITGSDSFQLMHPDDKNSIQKIFQESVDQKKGWSDLVIRWIHKDGSIRYFESSALPVFDVDDNLIGFNGIDRDITDRKQIENELRESEQKLSTHLQNTPIGAISWDLNFMTVEWNPAAETIFGYAKEEAIGKHGTKIILPEDMEELVDGVFQDLISGKEGTRSTNENITKDGERIICDWYNTTLKDSDGKAIGVASLVHDITERKRTETKLRESEQQLRLITDAVPALISYVDTQQRFCFNNKNYEKWHKLNTEEMKGKHIRDVLGTAFYRKIKANVETALSGNQVTFEIDTLNKNGDERCANTTYIPDIGADGKVRGFFALIIDVTQKKEAEAIIKRTNKLLEKKVKERTAGLEDMNIALKILLEKRDADKKEMEEKIFSNHDALISPFIQKLKNSLTKKEQQNLVGILESNLKEILHPFSKKLSDPMVNLTPAEIQISNMIKQGLSNKEIAQTLNNSVRTITNHRHHIRVKLGLKNIKINLRSYLSTL